MSEPSAAAQRCASLEQAANRTVVLAIDLVGATVRDSPQLLQRVLSSDSVQKALAEALRKAGQDMMEEQSRGQLVTFGQSMQRLGSAAGGVLRSPTESEVRKQREFLRLEQGLRELGCAFNESPVGVFVNENSTLLVVVGTVAALAGGVAMYYTRAGDAPASLLEKLPKLDVLKIGAVTISAGNFTFRPSERAAGASLQASGRWQAVKASLELRASFANDRLTQAAAGAQLTLTISPSTSINGALSFQWAQATPADPQLMQGSAEIGMRRQLSDRADLRLRLFGRFADSVDAGRTGTAGAGAGVTLKRPFGPGTNLTGGVDFTTQGPLGGQNPALLPNGQPNRPDQRLMLKLQLEF